MVVAATTTLPERIEVYGMDRPGLAGLVVGDQQANLRWVDVQRGFQQVVKETATVGVDVRRRSDNPECGGALVSQRGPRGRGNGFARTLCRWRSLRSWYA